MAVLAHYLNGDFFPWYLTCCQATSCYIQLFWVAEGNFRIQFRLSLKAVGIAACNVFTWKHTEHFFFFFCLKTKQSFQEPLLQTGTAYTTSVFPIPVGHHVNNERWTPLMEWTPLQMFRICHKCQTSLHGCSFTCLIARSCSWKFPGADRKNNFEIVFDRPAGRLYK